MIYGINANSFIDYPGKMSFVIFTGGCNFNCSFCHNGDIVKKTNPIYDDDTVLAMLAERKGFVDAVTITGGEPTIYGNRLVNFIKKIKALGYSIKLDTNGSNPDIVKNLLNDDNVDYIAMDLKNTFDKYDDTTACHVDISKIKKTIKIIEESNVLYEFRTTINKEMHSTEDIIEIINYVKDKSRFNIQPYRWTKNQLENVRLTEWSDAELSELSLKTKVSILK